MKKNTLGLGLLLLAMTLPAAAAPKVKPAATTAATATAAATEDANAAAKAKAREAAAETRAALQKLYTGYLLDEGYKPEVDKDGDVLFKREGSTYFIQIDDEDPEFFRLVYPNFWSIDSEEERARVLAAMDVANADVKVCKIFSQKDNLWASIETFVGKPDDFKPVFPRMISALRACAYSFAKQMKH